MEHKTSNSTKPLIEQALLLLAHAVSQITFRWLPPPIMSASTPNAATAMTPMLPSDAGFWRDLFLWWCDACDAPPYLRAYRKRRDPAGAYVADSLWKHIEGTIEAKGSIVFLGDADYPPLLAETADPPLALSVLGEPSRLRRPCVSIVGSRQASGHATAQSMVLGRVLAAAGITVVSGGAIGCDIAAHAGVLASGKIPAPAVIVLAGGLESFYPGANSGYFRVLRERRAVFLSERLWWMTSRQRDFPARNRIIAGMSATTAVMQAALKSGAMITARQALGQGRDVVALTHPPGDIRALGNMHLLQDGAVAMDDAEEWGRNFAGTILNTAACAADDVDYAEVGWTSCVNPAVESSVSPLVDI